MHRTDPFLSGDVADDRTNLRAIVSELRGIVPDLDLSATGTRRPRSICNEACITARTKR